MKNFIETARDKAMAPGASEDPSVEAWAARAFSMIAVLGGLDCINEDAGESLAICLSKAPLSVVASGTVQVVMAQAKADK